MTRTEIDIQRRRLVRLRDRLHIEFSHLRDEVLRANGGGASGNLSDLPLHPADLASDTSEEDVAIDLLGNEEKILDEVNAALARIEAGKFGRCISCQRRIGRARLRAMPYASQCVTCARKEADS